MEKTPLTIENGGHSIPALLWGERGDRLLLAVHGAQSHKADAAIERAALAAAGRGFCTLSFDLPTHGGRIGQDNTPCDPQNGVGDLLAVWRFGRTFACQTVIFACSLGACFSLLASEKIEPEALFLLSPVLDMRGMIEGMMSRAGVTAGELERRGVIEQPGGPPLDWGYYRYVCEHPVPDKLPPTRILRGQNDSLCTHEETEAFAAQRGAVITELEGAGHYFHTEKELNALSDWLGKGLGEPDIPGLVAQLESGRAEGCRAMELLVDESAKDDGCLAYIERFAGLLGAKSSLLRNRGLALVAANARWVEEDELNRLFQLVAPLLADPKPITVRQCVGALAKMAAERPSLGPAAAAALRGAEPGRYPDSMSPLIEKDIAAALAAIEGR